MKLKSALEAAGIKPPSPINLDLQAAAEYAAGRLADALGRRVLKNHIPAEKNVAFAARGCLLQIDGEVSQGDFLREYIRGGIDEVFNQLTDAGQYIAFTDVVPLTVIKCAVATVRNVQVRVSAFYAGQILCCEIHTACLAN